MFWTWIVLVLHVLSFVLPVFGILAIVRRVSSDLAEAVRVTAIARALLAWRTERATEIEALMGTPSWAEKNAEIDEAYRARIEKDGLSALTYGDVDVLGLTSGRSNLTPLAEQVRAARSDGILVLLGLVLGLAANLIPTIWDIPPLVS